MARMFNCATDFTYDKFVEDAKMYKATPRKGVYPSRNASEREKFMVWFKNLARDFKAEWLKEHQYMYSNRYGWIGDAFKRTMWDAGFSDYYKDVYNQRPHLDSWFYIKQLGLPMSEDVARTFCASPVEDAIDSAIEVRERLLAM